MLLPYKLFFKLEIRMDDNVNGTHYHPYGELSVNIGSLSVNQGVRMWKVNLHPATAIKAFPIGQSYFAPEYTYSFNEVESFGQNGQIYLYGKVIDYRESISSQVIGSVNDDLFQAKDILNNGVTYQYPQPTIHGYYIKVTLRLKKL